MFPSSRQSERIAVFPKIKRFESWNANGVQNSREAINQGTAQKMNKWEKLLLLKSRPNCDANCVQSQNERAQKTHLWCQGTRLINFSNKTAYNSW